MVIYRAADYASMSRKAANIISAQVIMKPDCVLGLATGSTPIGTYKQLGFAMKMSATPGTLQKRAPRLGEDTEAVLRGCGLSEAELDLLTKE